VPQLFALMRHWRSYPPVHVTAALFAGIKPQSRRKLAPVENVWQAGDVIADNDAMIGGGGIPVQVIHLPR
jgi:hypothetical protein